ncbi:hypothetical protein [Motilibacter aurantiacus]|uniref:hypothetical protein n=1 Tax=Motilibacter aurantiacus TaxID=2714955 RepID=UPI00140A922B|nr:hypothetical protein [Motilibacter aurantiacus]NHC44873.1 hypothetical protein [Motilibacter aurantiacus]
MLEPLHVIALLRSAGHFVHRAAGLTPEASVPGYTQGQEIRLTADGVERLTEALFAERESRLFPSEEVSPARGA